jgi:hypothetical protein
VNTAQKIRRRSSIIVGGAFRMSTQKKRSCNPRNKTLGSFFFFSFSGYKKAFCLEITKFLLFKSMGLLWVFFVIFERWRSLFVDIYVNNVDI